MSRMILTARIGANGVLQLAVPMGPADANREVRLTIEPVSPPAMTPEEWRNFVLATAGSITDPSFERHEQGEYERREELA
jgi:hypothetical protein